MVGLGHIATQTGYPINISILYIGTYYVHRYSYKFKKSVFIIKYF